MSEERIIDKDNYERCSVPFESAEEANAAMLEFWQQMYAMRNKYRVTEMLITFCVPVKVEGKVVEMFGSLAAGSELFTETLAAWALAKAESAREKRLAG